MSHKERIADFVRRFPGRDDDQISSALNIRPRQSINMACRDLESVGRIKRYKNASGKIGNYPTDYNDLNAKQEFLLPLKEVPKVGLPVLQPKPPLRVETLIEGGFTLAGRWMLSKANDLVPDRALPKGNGVYAFVKGDLVLYVGLATMGLAKRLYFYGKPGVSQLTNIRLNSIIKAELEAASSINIYTAEPADLEWNGLPVHGSAGLELGLIKKYALPWNVRSAG